MKLSVSTCTRLPSCGATPTVGFSTPARTHSAAGRGVNMMAKSIFKTSAALRLSAPWRRQNIYICIQPVFVWHVTLQRKLRLVVIVNRKAPTKPRSIVLASTDLALDGRKLVELYGARFQIEFLFRDSKQFTGLSDCQARAEAALDFHFNAALAPLNLARTEQLVEQTGESRQVFSMASWKQRQFNERSLDVFIEKLALEPSWVKKHPSYDELRSYGAIAA